MCILAMEHTSHVHVVEQVHYKHVTLTRGGLGMRLTCNLTIDNSKLVVWHANTTFQLKWLWNLHKTKKVEFYTKPNKLALHDHIVAQNKQTIHATFYFFYFILSRQHKHDLFLIDPNAFETSWAFYVIPYHSNLNVSNQKQIPSITFKLFYQVSLSLLWLFIFPFWKSREQFTSQLN